MMVWDMGSPVCRGSGVMHGIEQALDTVPKVDRAYDTVAGLAVVVGPGACTLGVVLRCRDGKGGD